MLNVERLTFGPPQALCFPLHASIVGPGLNHAAMAGRGEFPFALADAAGHLSRPFTYRL
jgi:hypothetical protein